MFSRIVAFTALAMPLLAAATPAVVERTGSPPPTTQCCQSTIPANSAAGTALLGSLGVVLQNLDVLLGLTCSPITVIGVGSGNTCSGTTVSCSSTINHSIGIGCIPITL